MLSTNYINLALLCMYGFFNPLDAVLVGQA